MLLGIDKGRLDNDRFSFEHMLPVTVQDFDSTSDT